MALPKGYKHSKETREARSELMKQKWADPEYRESQTKAQTGRRAWNKGKKCPQFGGENHWNWKGGIDTKYHLTRNCIEYKQWREAVFERDNYTCQHCGDKKGGNLHANHIVPFIVLLKNDDWETMFNIENGETLCESCHMKTNTFGNRVLKYKEGRVLL